MPNASMTRAENMAQTDPLRREVWTFLKGEGRPLLTEAAEAGRIPLTAVSALLIERFGAEALDPPIMRQFLGIASSAILSEEGFVIARTGVRLRGDLLFGSGTLFERARPAPGDHDNPLLARVIDGFIAALTADELAFAERRIRQRLQNLPQRQARTETGENEA